MSLFLFAVVGTEQLIRFVMNCVFHRLILIVCQITNALGETGRMYEANVDDVGYRLVAIYTPVREDGVEGQPLSASTEPIAIGNFLCGIIYRYYLTNRLIFPSFSLHKHIFPQIMPC